MFREIFGGVISALLLGVVACSDDNPSQPEALVPSVPSESCSSVEALSRISVRFGMVRMVIWV